MVLHGFQKKEVIAIDFFALKAVQGISSSERINSQSSTKLALFSHAEMCMG
jgi:hypothetical protein